MYSNSNLPGRQKSAEQGKKKPKNVLNNNREHRPYYICRNDSRYYRVWKYNYECCLFCIEHTTYTFITKK